MTKEDFVLIAHAIYSVDTTNEMKKRFADAIANTLLSTHPRFGRRHSSQVFDRARFVRACRENTPGLLTKEEV